MYLCFMEDKKYKRKQQEMICEECSTKYLKAKSEVVRNLRLGRKSFCSISCAGKGWANIEHLAKVRDTSGLTPDNRRDEFSMFRAHLRRALKRGKECDLTLEHMKEVFDKQDGKCIYSGVKLVETDNKVKNDQIYAISLDRTDSSKGYVIGNIQFVSIAMNHLKNSMTHEQMLETLEIIKKSF